MTEVQTASVLGARIDAGKMAATVDSIIAQAISGDNEHYICVANVHSVVTARRNAPFKQVLQEAWRVVSDGMPLVWVLWRQYPWAERIAGPDLMQRLCDEAQKQNVPVYFYGGSHRHQALLKRRIGAMYPALKVTFEVPPQIPEEPLFDNAIVEKIKQSGAGIVFVGLGCPKQEYWMHTHAPHIPAVLIGVGAAFDFMAGTKKRAPHWMRQFGLEWLFRLFSEPRRLWRRYFVTNSLFIYYLLRDTLCSVFKR